VAWIGRKIQSEDTFLPDLNMKWGRTTKSMLLEIEFSVNIYEIQKLNFDKKLIKLKQIIQTWNRRSLTPICRIHLIKSLMISQFNHLFITLPNPDDHFLNQLNNILFNFLWNGKTDKIKKRDVIVQNYGEGGLKMVNIGSFIDSLTLEGIRRLDQMSGKWHFILKTHIVRPHNSN